MLELQMGR